MHSRHACRRALAPGVFAVLTLVGAPTARAQTTLESVLRQQNAQNIIGYVQPLADLLAADLSIGFFHSASIAKNKLSFGLELVATGSVVGDDQKVYTAHTPPGFNPATFETATIFGGPGTEVTHASNSSLKYRGSDGFIDASYFPSVVPQLRVGGLFGTEVAVRYFSSSIISSLDETDFPELKITGFGVRHSISQYFTLPVDVAIGFGYNDVTWGDILEMDATTIGAQIGKTFSILSVYGGLASESGTMKLSYTSTDPNQTTPVSVDVDVKSSVRFTGGATVKLGFLQLFGDLGVGSITTFSGGLRFGL